MREVGGGRMREVGGTYLVDCSTILVGNDHDLRCIV